MQHREEITYCFRESALGQLIIAGSAKGVCAVLIGSHQDSLLADLRRRFPQARLKEGGEAMERLAEKVVAMIEHPSARIDIPLDIRGTDFQKAVWEAVSNIPVGQTASYGEIAKRVNLPRASRAVASACGANALAVIIPCHRVIKSDGTIAGYHWGVERRRKLLQLETSHP